MVIEDAQHRAIVQQAWGSPTIARQPGLKAVDLFRAVGDGRIKALWIMATNPVASMPDADAVRSALQACPFVVVSDVMRHTDTTACADVLLPAAAWGEKDGTVTNSERRISRQRAFRAPPGEARPDWWIVQEVARRMGHGAAFDFDGPAAVFREHAALSAAGNDGRRDFDLGGLATLEDDAYATLAPVQWPVPRDGAPPDSGPGRPTGRRGPDAPQHRQGPRPLAHDDADRPGAAAVVACGRALRRTPPGGRGGGRYRRQLAGRTRQ
jgi:assimilatory nitrate reductase catalytic subunit